MRKDDTGASQRTGHAEGPAEGEKGMREHDTGAWRRRDRMLKYDIGSIRRCGRLRRGIRLVDGSERLRQAHARKSRDSIAALQAVVDAGLGTWAASASYHAMYHAVYALFMRVGIKCEMQECTIAAFNEAFGDYALDGLASDLAYAKEARDAVEYYEGECDLGGGAGQRLVDETRRFVSAVDAFADGLDMRRIEEIRALLGALMAPRGGRA